MKKVNVLILAILMMAGFSLTAQVAVSTNGSSADGSAMLDVQSTTKGFLPPRMTGVERNAISSPAAGLVIWCSNCGTNGELQVYNGTAWTNLTGGTASVAWTCGDAFTDSRDAQSYTTVQIDNQCWMAENLNYDQSTYGGDWCHEDNSANCDTYGRLYDWAAVMQGTSSSSINPSGVQGVCPEGWHVPSDAEWSQLTTYVSNNGYSGTEGTALKATSGWNIGGNGTDNFGFTALPGGYRSELGNFGGIGYYGGWWSATEELSTSAWNRSMTYNGNSVGRSGEQLKEFGFSVRCLRD